MAPLEFVCNVDGERALHRRTTHAAASFCYAAAPFPLASLPVQPLSADKLFQFKGVHFKVFNKRKAAMLHKLASVKQARGDLDGAQEQYEQALAMKYAVYGEDAQNADLARTLNNLAIVKKARGDLDGATLRHGGGAMVALTSRSSSTSAAGCRRLWRCFHADSLQSASAIRLHVGIFQDILRL